jgi:hypothetical protein
LKCAFTYAGLCFDGVQHPYRVAVTRGPVVLVRKGLETEFADFSAWQADAEKPASFLTTAPTTTRFVPFYEVGRDEAYAMYFDRQA